ncbi:MAG TPA: MFS transporter, partial [Petrotogaceae bacterium]|nr:MFS transporter [Petrotogaceae bacterium]
MTLDNFIQQNVSRKKRLFLLIISSIGWALVAAGVMVTSLTINDIVAYWKLSKVFSAVMASSTFFGMIAGAVSSGLISDTFGRKNSCVIFSFIFTLFSFLGGVASTPEMFLTFRIIAGFGMGGLLPALNTYLAEFLNISIRGMYLVLLEASWAVGSIILGVFHLLFKNT